LPNVCSTTQFLWQPYKNKMLRQVCLY